MYKKNNREMMEKFKFDESYNQYFKARIKSSSDGTKVPGEDVLRDVIKDLGIIKNDKVLDLGCGFGRIFNEIKLYTNSIYGIDVDQSMINDAAFYDYTSLHAASAEDSRFPDNYFDKIVMLGTFDVVDQEKCLAEINRILKVGGSCLITGKNDTYSQDDEKAFIAEKNAKLKKFPNHFTDVRKMIESLHLLGYSKKKLTIFIRRGDFGNNKKIEIEKDWICEFYEYCIILEKTHDVSQIDIHFASEFSKTAKNISKAHKEEDVLMFFDKQER